MRCRVGVLGVGLAAVAIGAGSPRAQEGAADVEWRYYSGDNGASKYSPAALITADNVNGLRIVWRRPHLDPALGAANPQLRPGNNFRSTPIMVAGVLYASNGVGLVEAFDADTGTTRWVQRVPAEELKAGNANRGVAYWSEGTDRRILAFRNQYLYALDAATGEPVPGFGSGGRVDLTAAINSGRGFTWNGVPLVVRDVVVLGSSMAEQDSTTKMTGTPGNVYGFDVRTGRLRWTFNVIPRAGEPGVETWENESWAYTGAANVWAPMSGDDELGYVYLPTSSATNDMYGGHRLGTNLYSSSIVCLDARTGRRVWHFQTVHHDLFDYDNPAAPILADITVGGRRIKAVIQITKQSLAFVFDRATGEPVWPIEERPAPASTVPGERAFPTQPVPTKPPAFDRQGLTVDDLIDFTPELRAEAVAIMRKYVTGPMFTPPSVAGPGPEDTKGTIQLPGSVGGADWTGAAFDPETGMLYVPSMTNPFVANLLPGDPAQTDLRFRASTRELIQGPRGLPLTKPPYGRITAFDLNRGELAWTVANGDGPRNHPLLQSLNLPPLGQSVRAAPLVTKTLLFVSEGDQINVRTPPNGGGRKLRAFDKATGRVVWETELDAGTTGTLMTYVHNRRQYIVVAIGGQNHPGEFVAFATGSTTPTSAQAPSTPQPGSVFLEDLTWIEVRDAIAAGKTTIIIPTGGTEQNGPHMVLGKHNVLVRHKAGEIATQLGNALVAPVVAYVPEGDVSPPTGHMRFAGTITTPQDVFMKVLEYAARSFRQHGFTDIALVGDSGGNQEGQRLVAEALNKEWAATSARVHHVTAYYPGRGDDWVVSQGVSKEDVGTHAGTHDTSSLMYLNPSMLRVDRLQPGKTGDGQGHVGNPARATALFGKRILEMQIEDAARQIRELRVGSRR